MVLVPRPVHVAMSVLASAMNISGLSYKALSCVKNSSSLYWPPPRSAVACQLGGMYAMIKVKEKLGDLSEVAVASMRPVNTFVVRPVRSGEGVLPTQIPPAACLSLCVTGLTIAGLKEIVLKPAPGGAGKGALVSTRARMSTLSSCDVSWSRVRLCSLVCWPLQFQKRMETSAGFGRASGQGSVVARLVLGFERSFRIAGELASIAGCWVAATIARRAVSRSGRRMI